MERTRDVTGLPLGRLTDIKGDRSATDEVLGLPRADVPASLVPRLPLQPAHLTSRRPSIRVGCQY